MDKTELHYLTYDPDAIWEEMMLRYVEAGGDILYPGDEKEMLLRAVLACIVQVFAGVDNGLRMQTLRYATGEYLDVFGEQRDCRRIEATPAKATVTVVTNATGRSETLPAGTAMSADGELFWMLDEELSLPPYTASMNAAVTASEAGSRGNGLTAGTQLQLAVPNAAVNKITVLTDASGGGDKESDDAYRERIRTYGLASVTTGPKRQYEAVAMAVSSEIVDASAVKLGDGQVGVYVILADNTGAAAILQAVADALSAEDTRPLTDQVSVSQASDLSYTLNVKYSTDGGNTAQAAIAAAAEDYQNWQDNKIGRAFNPDRLMAAMYQAGATRVIWDTGSEFDGGAVEYTEIQETERCLGTITLTAI